MRTTGSGSGGPRPSRSARCCTGRIALFLILALAATRSFSLRLGSSDQGNDAIGSTTRTAYDLLAKGFGPGFNGPLQVVAETTDTAQAAAMTQLATTIQGQPGVAAVTPPTTIPAKDGSQVVLFQVYPTSAPQDAATTDLIDRLRDDVIPAAWGPAPGPPSTWVASPRSSPTSRRC